MVCARKPGCLARTCRALRGRRSCLVVARRCGHGSSHIHTYWSARRPVPGAIERRCTGRGDPDRGAVSTSARHRHWRHRHPDLRPFGLATWISRSGVPAHRNREVEVAARYGVRDFAAELDSYGFRADRWSSRNDATSERNLELARRRVPTTPGSSSPVDHRRLRRSSPGRPRDAGFSDAAFRFRTAARPEG